MPQTEIPSKAQGMVQLDRDVEGDWLLVDKSSAVLDSPGSIIDLRHEDRGVAASGNGVMDNAMLEKRG